tara:strand:- start:25 stop:696 length:672 start_codon:yes stop_codon:yes gene_type:complete
MSNGIAGLPAYQEGSGPINELKDLWRSIRREADDPSLAYTAGAMAPYTSMGADAVEVLAGLQDLRTSGGKSLGRVGLGIAGLALPGVSTGGYKAFHKALMKSTQEARKVGPYNPNLWLNKMKASIRRGMRKRKSREEVDRFRTIEDIVNPGRTPSPIPVDEDIVEELADHVANLYSQEGGDIDLLFRNAEEYVPDYLREAFENAVVSIEGTTPLIRELQKLRP